MQISKKKFIALMIVAFMAGGAVTGGIGMFAGGAGRSADKDFDKLEDIYNYIEKTYYEEPDMDKLMDGAYKGFIDALDDPYSSYMTKKEYDSWMTNVESEYSGVGITFSMDMDGNYVVVGVTKDSPAEDAGIKAGDILLKVDGKTYDDMDIFAAAIRGEEGTVVKLTYSRDDKEKTVSITREKITQHSVYDEMLDDATAYIAISSFIDNTADDFRDALSKAEKKGATKLILDLRNNGGGLLTSCIDVADEFLDKGTVVYVEGRTGKREEYEAKDGKTDLETVVLVNENSASAAEILAAAMQDNGFELVGKTTFGKGVIQSTVELDDGSAIKWTIMQYFSPKGNVINKKGVTPDHMVDIPEKGEKDTQLEKAKELLK